MNSAAHSDVSSDNSMFEVKDEVDIAICKCLEDQSALKKLKILKLNKNLYKVENKEYEFRILQGNNLAIRMHTGFIYADCLVHF